MGGHTWRPRNFAVGLPFARSNFSRLIMTRLGLRNVFSVFPARRSHFCEEDLGRWDFLLLISKHLAETTRIQVRPCTCRLTVAHQFYVLCLHFCDLWCACGLRCHMSWIGVLGKSVTWPRQASAESKVRGTRQVWGWGWWPKAWGRVKWLPEETHSLSCFRIEWCVYAAMLFSSGHCVCLLVRICQTQSVFDCC